MSYFDDASLVMIPSGYKTSKVYSVKPTDGTGDLTFTRSNDTATRVGPDALIEKVRTNVLLQSNSFDTTWTNTTSTETSGQAGYDGTNNAWLLEKSNFNGRIEQTISASGSLTFSVYAKAGTKNFVFLRVDGTAGLHTSYFDLQNGTTGIAALCTPSIEAAGNGYYRCSIAFNDTITIARIYVGDANGDTSGTSGNILIQASQLESGDVMTDYIATTTAAVSVGPVANVPRLDYLNSSCPRLLLEPQRTNLATYSEQFDNAAWTKTASTTITANANVSPSGYQDADTYTTTASGTNSQIYRVIVTSGTTQALSVFIKYLSGSGSNLRFSIGSSQVLGVDLTFSNSGSTLTGVAGSSVTSLKIEDYGNNWFRVSIAVSYASANTEFNIFRTAGSGTDAYAIWGAQLEAASSYATSYIGPTLGAAVTRGADAASKTGISSLIGQTEGTIFLEAKITALNQQFAIITSAAGNEVNRLQVYVDATGKIGLYRGDASVNILSASTYAVGSTLKIAAVYKLNDYALYVNGVSVGTDTSATIPPTPSVLYLAQYVDGTASAASIAQSIIFKTRLSNADLAALTA